MIICINGSTSVPSTHTAVYSQLSHTQETIYNQSVCTLVSAMVHLAWGCSPRQAWVSGTMQAVVPRHSPGPVFDH